MKATIFDGKSVRPYSSADAQVLSSATPYSWIDVVTAGDDPAVVALLKQMGFTEIVAAYTTRTYSSGMFQEFGENMLGSTFAAPELRRRAGPTRAGPLRLEQWLLRDDPAWG